MWQSYEVINAVAQGNCVVLETKWTAILAVRFGKLMPGDTMRARFAQFFEFHDGLIFRIRNFELL